MGRQGGIDRCLRFSISGGASLRLYNTNAFVKMESAIDWQFYQSEVPVLREYALNRFSSLSSQEVWSSRQYFLKLSTVHTHSSRDFYRTLIFSFFFQLLSICNLMQSTLNQRKRIGAKSIQFQSESIFNFYLILLDYWLLFIIYATYTFY